MTCTLPDCTKPARRGGLCWGHHKRRMRGQAMGPLREYGLPTGERRIMAALRLAESEGDAEAFERAKDLLRKHHSRRPRKLSAPCPRIVTKADG